LYLQVDLFFYREPEEAKQQDEDETNAIPDYGNTDFSAQALASDQWPVQGDAQWNVDVQAPISAVPTTTWAAAPEPGRTELHVFLLVY
jgi:small subunit ribosomal protein SAe